MVRYPNPNLNYFQILYDNNLDDTLVGLIDFYGVEGLKYNDNIII